MNKNDTKKTYIIAEMACSHDGSLDNAKSIIDAAASAGADAIQLQIWEHQNLVVPTHKDLAILKSVELTKFEWRELVNYTRRVSPNLDIIACVYDNYAADFAVELNMDAYKIHTADLSNFELLRKISSFGRRIDLSVGSSTYDEIAAALDFINKSSPVEIWLMYGKQLFPTDPTDADINQAVNLGRAFNLTVGYQDHTNADSEEALLIPILALGAEPSIAIYSSF